MKAILVTIRGNVRGRPLQTGVVLVLTLLAAAMAAGSLTVLTKASDSYDIALERLTGPHLLFTWNAGRVTPAQLMATSHLPGITGTGQVHPVAVVPVELGKDKFVIEVVGRDSIYEAVDRYELADGRWPERPGEIAVTRLERPDWSSARVAIGDRINVLSRADRPSFVVVGKVVGMPRSPARAFVRSDDVAPLTDSRSYPMGYELAYRVARPETAASLAGYTASIRAALPPGAESAQVATSVGQRLEKTGMSSLAAPQLVFALLALVCAAFIVGNVVTGTILGSQRELGVMQAIGFSRRQVVVVVAGGAVLPALIGGAIGILIGVIGSQGTLAEAGSDLVEPIQLAFSPILDLAILGVIVLVVGVAAALSARHAGRADPARAISLGQTPSVSSDGFLARALRSLPLPRPVRLGLGDTFLRPVRSLITISVLAIAIGVMTFALGLEGLVATMTRDPAIFGANYGVTVERFGPLSDAEVRSALDADPGINAYLGAAEAVMTIDGAPQQVRATATRGDAAALDYRASAGRWFDGPGEAVMAGVTMSEVGVRIGDVVTGSIDGQPIRLRIVGRYEDWSRYDDRGIRFDWTTYETLHPGQAPRTYLASIRPGASATTVAKRLEQAHPHFLRAAFNQKLDEVDRPGPMVSGYVAFPAYLLLLIGAIAVFNTILLNTTERGFDHAVLKAIGMSPRQVMAMAVSPAIVIALLGVVVGLPIGTWLYRVLLDLIAGGASIEAWEQFFVHGLDLVPLIWVVVSAMAFAIAGALLPASWAAHRPVINALRAE
jgi:putative ABC transport system permease protein